MRPFVPPWRPFADLLSNARIIFYSDNQNVDFLLLNGSRKLDLEAFQTCLKYRISLDTRWIPRVLNVRVTPSESFLISTIMLLMILFFRVFKMFTGDCIPSIGSTVVTIPNYQGSIPGFFSPAVRQLTPFLRTGDTTTGSAPGLSNCQNS